MAGPPPLPAPSGGPGEAVEVAGQSVGAGERAEIEIPLERLATGPWITIPTVVLNGRRAGPTVCVSAAVHGDEVNGVEAIRQLLVALRPQEMSGTLLMVPVVNELGFMAGRRELPDGRDLNRTFPGSPTGSLAARLAALFMEQIVSRCEYAIDLHSGTEGRANLPQIRADLEDERTRAAAEAFGAPAMIHARTRDGSLREAASDRGIAMLLYEGGEAARFDADAIDAAHDGIRRVLASLGVLDGAPGTSGRTFASRETRWVRADRGGMLRLAVGLGDLVDERAVLGDLSDIYGRRNLAVRAPAAGLVIGVNRKPLVNQGDALVHVAEPA